MNFENVSSLKMRFLVKRRLVNFETIQKMLTYSTVLLKSEKIDKEFVTLLCPVYIYRYDLRFVHFQRIQAYNSFARIKDLSNLNFCLKVNQSLLFVYLLLQ